MDNLFFVLSKLFWGLASPTNLIVFLMVLATIFVITNKLKAAKIILIPLALVSLILLAYPISDYLIEPLETRFSKPAVLPEKIDGIILLGGGEDLKASLSWQSTELGAAGDRYLGAVFLAKYYPNVPVIFSGGNNLLQLQGRGEESHIAQQVLMLMGIEAERIIVESKARNTFENFVFIKALLPKQTGRYLVVTSAFHMPRAIGIARQQNINVIAYPVDYRSNKASLRQWDFNLFEHLEILEPAWREWLGLTVYYFTGKTEQWLPSES